MSECQLLREIRKVTYGDHIENVLFVEFNSAIIKALCHSKEKSMANGMPEC